MRATPLSRPRSTHLTRTHPGSATRIRPDQVEGKTMAQPGEAEMTSQQRADVDGSREPARAAADQQQDRDTIKPESTETPYALRRPPRSGALWYSEGGAPRR